MKTGMEACGGDDRAPRTFLVALDLVGAVVFAVVEVVAAEGGADAASVRALELILLTYGCRRWSFWKMGTDMCDVFLFGEGAGFIANVTFDSKPTAVVFIAVVAAVVDAVASSGERQAHAVVEAAELPGGRTLELHWDTHTRSSEPRRTNPQKCTVRLKAGRD